MHLLEELDAAGVAFRSATEPIDTSTAAGRMLVQLLGVFAEFERATIIDRVIAGMERKAARGGWTAGRRPYGLTVTRDAFPDGTEIGGAGVAPDLSVEQKGNDFLAGRDAALDRARSYIAERLVQRPN